MRQRTSTAQGAERRAGLLTVVTSAPTAARLNAQLFRQLEEVESSRVRARITWRPETVEKRVHWSQGLGLWWHSERLTNDNRWWNPFGLEDPRDDATLRIDCEINFPVSGINRRVGAVLLQGSDGDHFVGHRGKVGGGKEGITKDLFWTYYPGEPVEVLDSGPRDAYRTARVALIGKLGDARLPSQIASFVTSVHDVKEQGAGRAALMATGPSGAFSPEFEGPRRPASVRDYTAVANHGRVVRSLRERLVALLGSDRVFNTRNWDLYVRGDRDVELLLEVKSDSFPSSVYEAIGQLKYHATDRTLPEGVGLAAVFPSDIGDSAARRIEALGIHVIRFADRPSGLDFEGLERLFGDRR